MNRLIDAPRRAARRLLPFSRPRKAQATLTRLPGFAVAADAIEIWPDPAAFRQQLLALIEQAQERIVLVMLYLQDDSAGREILDALYTAQQRRPTLSIELFVDWHRAQRGLIGKVRSEGNAGCYRAYAARHGDGVRIYGVPVQSRELFGVLHLKGFVIDDSVVYSGASLNDVYLARHGRYRLDRYHRLRDRALADSMVDFVHRHLVGSEAVCLLNRPEVPRTRELQATIRGLRQDLLQARYQVPHAVPRTGQIRVTPLLGFGRVDNQLNETLLALLRSAQGKVILLTPYFNLPRPVRAVLGQLLRRGCRIDIVVGDKTANDFYIPPEQPFNRIGLLPYLYEGNLRRFARTHQQQIERGQLNIHLWKHADNSYHLKGLFVDDDWAVLTGNNLNPRAWTLDLENALLLHDPAQLLGARHRAEVDALLRHTRRLHDYHDLESTRDYPDEVRKRLKRLNRIRLDRLLNRLL